MRRRDRQLAAIRHEKDQLNLEAATQQSIYALGHSNHELERLSRQAQVFEPFTRQLLQQAGICSGLRVLDVGCGPGDVTFLAATLVGPTGEVVGTDCAPAALQRAVARAKLQGVRNVKFVEGDPTEMQFDRRFDAVIGRLVLMYYPDPVVALRKLTEHVCDGGLIVFQELDLSNCRSVPCAPTFERHTRQIMQTLSATGARTQLGLELYSAFVAAGLPGPSMRMDAMIAGRADSPVYELLAETTRSLLPVMEELKIATATEAAVSSLAQRIRDEVVATNGVAISPGLIGSWSRKSR